MRLVIEILVIILLGFFVYKKIGGDKTIKELSEELENNRQEQIRQTSKIDSLNLTARYYRDEYKKLKKTKEIQEGLLKDAKKDIHEIEKAYRDSLERLRNAKIEELVSGATQIIKRNDSVFVVITEKFYRSLLEDRVTMRKVKMKNFALKDQIAIQDTIMSIQEDQIFNLMDRLNNKKQIINRQDTIITHKNMEVDILEEKADKYKKQRNITIGTAGVIILLILL
jgi:hypothetical protein